MFKILLIDRCHYTRMGLEMWINHSGLFPSPVLVTGLNNLFLAREHILQWKPALVIADFQGFTADTQQFSSVMNASETVPFILLHSDEPPDMTAFTGTFALGPSLPKTTPLKALAKVINETLAAQECNESGPAATTLLTRQEEKVLTLWMDGASNQKIASKLSIHGKTVYTYKRNIRMKLHMDTRYSPFLSLP
ncbi:LuxR C-terminal-related transcriptional regulator [Leclercia adecarboxylata]|uniref:LuxR C-terminal-related transcriptional regulator n=1 Tax=Leclercia adecarboxylata TaxID=83655 RepID=UPI00202A7465|nr:LuxR C-terminal-related transcriptional regulator [Leclercia adecarboxylata]URN99645.1 LuxR C-terminal-related transcriptional regulator [Leclercia adecarboxylata]